MCPATWPYKSLCNHGGTQCRGQHRRSPTRRRYETTPGLNGVSRSAVGDDVTNALFLIAHRQVLRGDIHPWRRVTTNPFRLGANRDRGSFAFYACRAEWTALDFFGPFCWRMETNGGRKRRDARDKNNDIIFSNYFSRLHCVPRPTGFSSERGQKLISVKLF